jgi:hypothetical protein
MKRQCDRTLGGELFGLVSDAGGLPEPAARGYFTQVSPLGRPRVLGCRGTWARVNIDQFRHLALRTFYGDMVFDKGDAR